MMTAPLSPRQMFDLRRLLNQRFAVETPFSLGYTPTQPLPAEGCVTASVDAAFDYHDRPWVKVDVHVLRVPEALRQPMNVDALFAAARLGRRARRIADDCAPAADVDYLVEVFLLA